MKYIAILCAIFLLACKNKGAGNGTFPLHFDGMYKSAVQTNQNTGDQSTNYLRFYEDGTVINVSSSGTPEQIKSWFVKGHENVLQTSYQVAGDGLKFHFKTTTGDLDYNGRILSIESLQLHVKSASNNLEDDAAYSFVAD